MKTRFSTGLLLGLLVCAVLGAAVRVIQNLQDLTNVRLAASPSNNDVLTYSTTLAGWTNAAASGGSVTNYGQSFTNISVYNQTNFGTIHASGQIIQFANTSLREVSSSYVGTLGGLYANGIYNDGAYLLGGSAPSNQRMASANNLIKFQTGDGSAYTNIAAQVAFVQAGSATNLVRAGGVLFVDTTQTGNVGVGEDVLQTNAIPANALAANGDGLYVRYNGTFGASINTKTIKVKFGATTIFDTGALAITSAGSWWIDVTIRRTGAATQKCAVAFHSSDSVLSASTGYATAAETLSGIVGLQLTGEATDNNDIVKEIASGSVEPAP